jgi:hypothetical protein
MVRPTNFRKNGPGGLPENRRRRKTWVGALSLLAALSIITLQFLPAPPRTNPPVVPGRTIEANLPVPASVSSLLHRVCANCHSNETKWPWYARIAPLSWAIAIDVNSARGVMNLSEWSSGPGANRSAAISWLTMACADVEADRMPLGRYRLLHPEARLSAQEKAMLCEWTRATIASLASQ